MMSKVLAVVYSYTGTSLRLAHLLVAQQRWTLAEVIEVHPRSSILGTWRCLLDSFLRRCPDIHYDGPNLIEFDAVVLISPIWAYRLARPLRRKAAGLRSSRAGGEGQFARCPPVNVVAAGHMRLCCSAPLSRYTAPSEDMQQAQDSHLCPCTDPVSYTHLRAH